jgi:hypothetical protein
VADRKKPFEQYTVTASTGERVARVTVSEPRSATAWVVATGKANALNTVRELGGGDVHLVSDLRPYGEAVELAAASKSGGVFVPRSWLAVHNSTNHYYELSNLADYLATGDDIRYP